MGSETMTAVAEAPARPTIPLVRAQVRDLLERAPTFRSLPEDQRRQLAYDMVNVGQYIADAGGETFGVPLAAAISQQPARPPLAGPYARGLADKTPPPDTAGAKLDAQGGAVAASSGVDALTDLVESVDFPTFVASLVKGVFRAIVDASIQQMEAFAELVKNVSKSVDEYMKDNISENQARDYLADKYSDHLAVDITGDQPKIVPKESADESQMPDFFKDLGLDMPIDSLDEDTTEHVLMPAARQQLAIDRQRMLLMLVLMGINRLVVTDGSIKAAVIFQLNTKDMVKQHRDFASTYDRTETTNSRSGWFSGWFSPSWTSEAETKLNVTTHSSQDSEASVELKARLSGDVNVRFKSETYPLAQMTSLLGLQEPTLPTTQPRTAGTAVASLPSAPGTVASASGAAAPAAGTAPR
jgi:hypothetical protein